MAVVKNKLPKKNDVIENYLTKNQAKNKSFISNSKNGKYSKLEYNQVKKLDNYFIYEINPFTGRHHQIRVQLASMGSPIKGDIKYGAKRTNNDGGISLHAREINFTHPVKKEKTLHKMVRHLNEMKLYQFQALSLPLSRKFEILRIQNKHRSVLNQNVLL